MWGWYDGDRSPKRRVVELRVASAFSAFRCAYPDRQLPVVLPLPPQLGDPPFALGSPNLGLGKVPDAEQETAAMRCGRTIGRRRSRICKPPKLPPKKSLQPSGIDSLLPFGHMMMVSSAGGSAAR